MPTEPAILVFNAVAALLVQLAPAMLVYNASRRLLHGRIRMRGILLAAVVGGLFAMAVILSQMPAMLFSKNLSDLVTGEPLMIAAGASWLCVWGVIGLELAVRRRKIRY